MNDSDGILVLAVSRKAWAMRRKQFYFVSQHEDDILSYTVFKTFLAFERFKDGKGLTVEQWLLWVALRAVNRRVSEIVRANRTLPTCQLPSVPIVEDDKIVYTELEIADSTTIPYYEPLLDELAEESERTDKKMKPIVYLHKKRRLANAYRTP